MKCMRIIVGLLALCLLIAGCAGVPGENSREETTGGETVTRAESAESSDSGIVSAESSEESPADGGIDWDANRDWPVYHGEVPDIPLDVLTDIAEISLKAVVQAFDHTGAELLFHVAWVPYRADERGVPVGKPLRDEELAAWEAWMKSIGVPPLFHRQKESSRLGSYSVYHFNLSYRDMYEIYRQGLEIGYYTYFTVCTNCEEYLSMTNIASPEIPQVGGGDLPKHPHVSRGPS